MDKFNRRPTRRDQIKRLIIAVLAFAGVSIVAAALPVLGPKIPERAMSLVLHGYLWIFAICVVILGAFVTLTAAYNAGILKLYSLRRPVAIQPIQGPGFTAFELAAFSELLSCFPGAAADMRVQWMLTEVLSRTNTGFGCLSQLWVNSSASAAITSTDISSASSLWRVSGLANPVTCTFWVADGCLDLIEFAVDEESSAETDWAHASFDLLASKVVNTRAVLPPIQRDIPLSPPIHRA